MEIRIAAAALMRADGATLMLRKRGSGMFIHPGGKIEAGETPLAALLRELEEELGLRFAPEAPEWLGRFSAPAANEPGRRVVAEVFRLDTEANPAPRAEIEESRWIHPQDIEDPEAALRIAPLSLNEVLPRVWGNRYVGAQRP